MELQVGTGGGYEVRDAGIYEAELVRYEDMGMGDYGKELIRLDWRLFDPETGDAYEELYPRKVSKLLVPRSTLYAIVCALTGKTQLDPKGKVNLDSLVGRSCQITLSREVKEDGIGETNKALAYTPIRRRAGAPVTSAPARAAAPAAARPQAVAAGVEEPPF